MNQGSLNTRTLNGGTYDPVVRTQVMLNAYGYISTIGRVFVYGRASGGGQAVVTAPGRVEARSAVSIPTRANLTVAAKVFGRLVVAINTSTTIVTTIQRIRVQLSLVARATVSAVGRVFVNTKVSSSPTAEVDVVPRALIRSVFGSVNRVSMFLVPRVFPRGTVREPVNMTQRTSVATGFHVETTQPVITGASAVIAVTPRLMLTNPVTSNPSAQMTVDFEVIKRVPWDEPAPGDRVFQVPSGTFVFKVA